MMVVRQVLASTDGPGVVGGVVGVISLTALAVLLFVLFRRFTGEALPDTPSSGRWVAGLRVAVDVVIGAFIAGLMVLSVAFIVSPEGLGTGGSKLNIGYDGITMALPPGGVQGASTRRTSRPTTRKSPATTHSSRAASGSAPRAPSARRSRSDWR